MNRRELIRGIGKAICVGAVVPFIPSLLGSEVAVAVEELPVVGYAGWAVSAKGSPIDANMILNSMEIVARETTYRYDYVYYNEVRIL